MTKYFHLTNDCDHSKNNDLLTTSRILADAGIFITHAVHTTLKSDGSALSLHCSPFDTQSLDDVNYCKILKEMVEMGHEICYHGYSQSHDTREEFLRGIEIFTDKMGFSPSFYIEHGGHKDFNPISMVKKENLSRDGNNPMSEHYIGDLLTKFEAVGISNFYTDRAPYAPKKMWEKGFNTKILYRTRNINLEKITLDQCNVIAYTHFGYAGYYPQKLKFLKPLFKHRVSELWCSRSDIKRASKYLQNYIENNNFEPVRLSKILEK